jgi:hypothetical protein
MALDVLSFFDCLEFYPGSYSFIAIAEYPLFALQQSKLTDTSLVSLFTNDIPMVVVIGGRTYRENVTLEEYDL